MIEIKTKYTFEIYREYYWFSLFRGKYYRYGKAALPFITILTTALFIFSFFRFDGIFPTIILTGMASICIFLYIAAYIIPKKYVKQSPLLFQSSMEITFDDNNISLLQTGDMENSSGTAKYEDIYKVYETNNTFYLYLSPSETLILTKKDFVKSTPDQLRGLLQSKLSPGKYILCK